jgi:hypothetical protein
MLMLVEPVLALIESLNSGPLDSCRRLTNLSVSSTFNHFVECYGVDPLSDFVLKLRAQLASEHGSRIGERNGEDRI